MLHVVTNDLQVVTNDDVMYPWCARWYGDRRQQPTISENVEKYTTKQILSKTYVAHLFHVWYQFQIRTVLSHEPVATAKPSGDTPSVRSFWSCPISSPVSSVFNVSNVYVTFGCIIGEWNSSE